MADNDSLPSERVSEEHVMHLPYRNRNNTGENSSNGGSMLCVNFSTPLAGAARSERIKQISSKHKAFENVRYVQGVLVKVQQSLRRMPGVSAPESNEIVKELQDVGQVISQETSQLVDALSSLGLDQEDTDKAIARLSMDATLAKAQSEGHAQTIEKLRSELAEEKSKKEEAESSVREVMGDLQSLATEFKTLQDKAGAKEESKASRDDLIKSLEDTIKHLEDQVNNRRSLWVMKHSDPHSVARAIETLTASVPDAQSARNPYVLASTNSSKSDGSQVPMDEVDMPPPSMRRGIGPGRPPSVFQPLVRTPTAQPSKFSPLLAGPPRAPSTTPFDRRATDPWVHPGQQGSRPSSTGDSVFHQQSSSFSRPTTSRQGYATNGSRYRPTAPDFQPSGSGYSDPYTNKNNTPYGAHRGSFHNSMLSPQGRNKYGRLPDSPTPNEYMGNHHKMAIMGRGAGGHGYGNGGGQLIQMNEETVAIWNAQIMEFYQVIRGFVERHAGIPDSASSLKLTSTTLWQILAETYRPLTGQEANSYMYVHLRNENAKSCLVTRVIVDYVVNRVWVPSAWTGADSESTYALTELQQELDRTQGQPSASRQPLLDRQAAIIDSIMRSNHGRPFCRHKVTEVTHTLIHNIQPLFNKLANPIDVHNDLEMVAENAWELSSKILTSRLTFDFRFPEIGSRFSCQSMIPIWPAMDPMELQAKHWRVALVTTPVITCRNDTGTNISAHSVALADVFCMQ